MAANTLHTITVPYSLAGPATDQQMDTLSAFAHLAQPESVPFGPIAPSGIIQATLSGVKTPALVRKLSPLAGTTARRDRSDWPGSARASWSEGIAPEIQAHFVNSCSSLDDWCVCSSVCLSVLVCLQTISAAKSLPIGLLHSRLLIIAIIIIIVIAPAAVVFKLDAHKSVSSAESKIRTIWPTDLYCHWPLASERRNSSCQAHTRRRRCRARIHHPLSRPLFSGSSISWPVASQLKPEL